MLSFNTSMVTDIGDLFTRGHGMHDFIDLKMVILTFYNEDMTVFICFVLLIVGNTKDIMIF